MPYVFCMVGSNSVRIALGLTEPVPKCNKLSRFVKNQSLYEK